MGHHVKEEDNFISYLGFLARSKVRIVYSAWKFVPDKTKELIWTQILQTFDVPNTKAMKKHWMGELWNTARFDFEALVFSTDKSPKQSKRKPSAFGSVQLLSYRLLFSIYVFLNPSL
ncbi:hypothetical protein K1719_002785 [Acacia pycnantha]|nr:hypothetical protein K1719_002785 [Acacia pycnantha]